jgi:hypothetical protein
MTADLLGRQQRVEGARKLRISIVDQEPPASVAVVERHQQVARLLQHPSSVRFAGAGEILDSAAADRKEHEHVQAVTGPRRRLEERVTVVPPWRHRLPDCMARTLGRVLHVSTLRRGSDTMDRPRFSGHGAVPRVRWSRFS